MSDSKVKAFLNLHAVLPNLEDLVRYDSQARQEVQKWKRSVQFFVPGGPAALVAFKNGTCTVTSGVTLRSDIILGFVSYGHLNQMMDGKGVPGILRGMTKIPFLMKQFPKVTDRLEHFLRPDDEKLKDADYLALNTRLTLNTAARACSVLSKHDPVSEKSCARIRDGVIQLEVGNTGPRVHLTATGGILEASVGAHPRPLARMHMKDVETANQFLTGKTDPFTAIASGDVQIAGQTPMLDNLSLVLDRVERFLA